MYEKLMFAVEPLCNTLMAQSMKLAHDYHLGTAVALMTSQFVDFSGDPLTGNKTTFNTKCMQNSENIGLKNVCSNIILSFYEATLLI